MLESCPTCYLPNPDSLSFLHPEVKERYFARWAGPRYSHTVEEVHREFERILDSTGARYKKLIVKAGTRGEGVYDTHIELNGIVTLTYNPYIISCQNKESLLACLKHEVCHVLTIPMSNVPVPDTRPEMMEFLANQTSCYDEYLAHREYLKRWPKDSDFRRYKEREFDNFTVILLSLRRSMREGIMPNPLSPFNILSVIFQDAVYFTLVDEEKLRDWAGKYQAAALLEFFGFWFTDFTKTFNWSLERDRTLKMVQLSAALSISVSLHDLVNQNTVGFDPSTSGVYTQFMANRKTAEEQELISDWMGRVK